MKFPEIREIRTQDLILRKLRREDAPWFFRFAGSQTVAKYMLWNPHRDISDSVASIEKALLRYQDGRFYRWGITRRENGELIGIIDLLRFDEQENSCSFAYMIAEEFWGRGYGTQALKAVLDFAFSEMELSFVEADHMAANPASGAVMGKAGMVRIRTDERKYEKNGQIYDAPVYRITETMWKNGIS